MRRPLPGVVLSLLVALSAALLVTQPVSAAEPVRIMPLDDSLTGSPGCWRALLWNRLQDTGYTDIDFVGTLGPQGCGVPYDGDNEGHRGALVTTVADQNQLPAWLSATDPDVVLMHFGTNDVWSNRSTSKILAAYSTLVDGVHPNDAGNQKLSDRWYPALTGVLDGPRSARPPAPDPARRPRAAAPRRTAWSGSGRAGSRRR